METHHNEECPKRIIECVHCQDEFTFIQKQVSTGDNTKRFVKHKGVMTKKGLPKKPYANRDFTM